MAQFDSYIRILRASLLPDQFDDFFTVTDQSWNEPELDHKGPRPKMGFNFAKAWSSSHKKLGTRLSDLLKGSMQVRITREVKARSRVKL